MQSAEDFVDEDKEGDSGVVRAEMLGDMLDGQVR